MAVWEDERRTWATAHGVVGKPGSPQWARTYALVGREDRAAYENRFLYRYHRELDLCQGSCALRQRRHSSVVADALLFWHGHKGCVGDFVAMPNHVHALVTPRSGVVLEDWLGSVKKFSAKRINAGLGRAGTPFWQAESYDHIIRDREELAIFRRYIQSNPHEAGLKGTAFRYHRAEWMDRWCDMAQVGAWLGGDVWCGWSMDS